jgi:hypothetical protein
MFADGFVTMTNDMKMNNSDSYSRSLCGEQRVSDTATKMIVVVMSRIKATVVVQRYVTSFNMVSCQIKPTRRHQIVGASETEVLNSK